MPARDLTLELMTAALKVINAHDAFLAFVQEIADDDYYSSGADRTDVQRAARELLGEFAE